MLYLMRIIKIETKYGNFYIENFEGRTEKDRISLYDSLGRWFDYFTIECIEETWGGSYGDFVEEIMRKAKSFTKVDELLDYLGIDTYTISTNWEDLLEDMYPNEGEIEYDEIAKAWKTSDGEIITEETILQNEWVNKIGENYILICDNWR